jgi:hypothetical protein
LSVQAAIGKEHRHEGKYIYVKFGYVAQSTMNLPSSQHKTRAFIVRKMYSKLKVLKSCAVWILNGQNSTKISEILSNFCAWFKQVPGKTMSSNFSFHNINQLVAKVG